MRVIFANAARQDLRGIVRFIKTDNPAAAQRVHEKIMAAAQRLADFPALGRHGWLPDTRELVVAGVPYVIVYQVQDDTVTVLAVFHQSRDLVHALTERDPTRGA